MRRTLVLIACVVWTHIASAQDGELSLLAVGDINLGRSVGQILLKDSIEYPFQLTGPVLRRHSVVFGNLESPITDQGGETRHPRDPYIFCAPPQAAKALGLGGFTVLSLANNHMMDYGIVGLTETIGFLDSAGILHTGGSKDLASHFSPAIIERGGVRVGFVAYTEFVNRKGGEGRVSMFETERMHREVGAVQPSTDIVVASYHGGKEYAAEPGERTLRQLRMLIDAGADVVIGHHPHVPQGIEQYKGKWIFYSLGNFVFLQPQREWTQKSFAVSMKVRKRSGVTSVEDVVLIPLTASNQPSFNVSDSVRESLFERLQRHSPTSISRKDSVLGVN